MLDGSAGPEVEVWRCRLHARSHRDEHEQEKGGAGAFSATEATSKTTKATEAVGPINTMGFASAFGPEFFYRVALPGVVVTAFLSPFLLKAFELATAISVVRLDATTVLIICAVATGLVLRGSIRLSYYLYEGFLWPRLTAWRRPLLEETVRKKAERLNELQDRKRTPSPSARDELEASLLTEYLEGFPLRISGEDTEYRVSRPTRLGNVIEAYELYPESRYGIDGVFYWHHIVFKAPAYAQAELDRSHAVADGMVLAAFASLLSCGSYCATLAARAVGELAPLWTDAQLPAAPLSDAALLTTAAAAAAVSWIFQRMSISAHVEFGKQFRAIADLVVPELVSLGSRWLPSERQRRALDFRQQYLQFGGALEKRNPEDTSDS